MLFWLTGTFDSQDNINIGAFIISVPELEGDHIDIAVPGGAAVTSGGFPFRTKSSASLSIIQMIYLRAFIP